MKAKLVIVFLIIFICLCGCSSKAIFQLFISDEIDGFVRQFLNDLNQTEMEKLQNNELGSSSIAGALGKGKIEELQCATYRQVKTSGKTQTATTYQMRIGEQWYQVALLIESQGDEKTVQNFQLTEIPASLEEMNSFSFQNKTSKHYLFFGAAILLLLLTLFSGFVCYRSDVPKKLLWFALIFVAITKINMNWTTGEISLLFTIYAPGNLFTFVKGGPYSPCFLSISPPVGVVIFWIIWLWWRYKKRNPQAIVAAQSDATFADKAEERIES